MSDNQNLHPLLPFTLPQPCPVCGSAVVLTGVVEWGADDGIISGVEYDCETEPDFDSEGWEDWFEGHHVEPYLDWLPWEKKMLAWLNEHYFYPWGN